MFGSDTIINQAEHLPPLVIFTDFLKATLMVQQNAKLMQYHHHHLSGLQQMRFVRILQPQIEDCFLFLLQEWRESVHSDDAICLQASISGRVSIQQSFH